MPRTLRASRGGVVYHVINRGNNRAAVFRKDDDYEAFLKVLGEASERLPMRLTGFCLMRNHFHLLLWPYGDGDLSRWMQWLTTTHVRRHFASHQGGGHLWQGRFKSFPVQTDEHYLTVLRYIEANPLRAGLVDRAQDWRWSSLHKTSRLLAEGLLHAGPLPRGPQWTRCVNSPQTKAELARLRKSVQRGTPFGELEWALQTATDLGLESTLRPRGRPRKEL